MNDTFDLRISESHIEVHKFHGGTILLCVIFSLVLQAFLPVYIHKAGILDLPLLITIYFGLSRRNPSTGLLLGKAIVGVILLEEAGSKKIPLTTPFTPVFVVMLIFLQNLRATIIPTLVIPVALLGTFIGLLQDSLSKTPLCLFGIAKTVIGYLASSIGARLDTEHPLARFALTAAFFALHQGIVVLVQKLLLAQPQPWFTMRLLIACVVNAILGVFLYHFLDRLRKS